MFNVLVVEDNKDLAFVLGYCFTMKDMKAHVAHSVAGALRIVDSGVKVDAIVCDFHLGSDTAPELIARLGKRAPKIRFLYSGTQFNARQHPGFTEYLLKPIDFDILRSKMYQHLKGGSHENCFGC